MPSFSKNILERIAGRKKGQSANYPQSFITAPGRPADTFVRLRSFQTLAEKSVVEAVAAG
jgi:hypothetical protein